MRTISSSFEELKNINVPSEYYSLGYAEEAICIEKDNEEWIVYTGERGSKLRIKRFYSESEACDYFVDKVKSLVKNKI